MSRNKFEVIGNNECLVLTSADCKGSNKIAAYDLDGTLIKTVSGGVFPTDIRDWQLNYTEVARKLQNIHAGGFKIVIFTNQAFIQFGTFTVSEIREKFEAIQRKIGVPMQFFAAGSFDMHRKPRIAMWELLQTSFNDTIPIDLNVSFFVGDAAGRIDSSTRRRIDHSCADRLFAMNLGLQFLTPEQHFLGDAREENFVLPSFDPRMTFKYLSLLDRDDVRVKFDEPELIVMVGFPGSGKSFYVSKYLKEFGIVNPGGNFNLVKSILINNKSCVVDDRHPDTKSRAELVRLGRELKVKVRCFHVTTAFHHCRHNLEFREVVMNTWRQVSNEELQKYESCYSEPKLEEGFDEVVKVNFVPDFGNDHAMKRLYGCYLIEK